MNADGLSRINVGMFASQTRRSRDLVVLRSARVKFVQQVGRECVRPAETGLEGTHVGVRQRLCPIVSDCRVGDYASGRVEPVQIQAEEQAIAGAGLVVQTGRNHQVVTLSCTGSEIGIQRVQSVRYLLQVYGISRVRRAVAARYRQGSVRRRQRWSRPECQS